MISLVTYSAENMTRSRGVCVEAARRNGCNLVFEFDHDQMDRDFRANNAEILSGKRGKGYWLSKPYFINKIALQCNDGDILIYCDAGVKLINDVNHIIRVMDQDIFLFSNGHQHANWCKADVMEAINHKQIDASYQQVHASVIFFRINQYTRNFIKEWLLWCQMPGMIDDSPSKLPNHPEFAEHRYDQAILCSMAYRDGIRQHYWADQRWYSSQRYRWPEDKYPLMFDQHRFRNKGQGGGDVEWPE